jgi:hypothetical protein
MPSIVERGANYGKEHLDADKEVDRGQQQGSRMELGFILGKSGDPDQRRVAVLVWHGLGIPPGSTITQAKIELTSIDDKTITDQTGFEFAIPRDDGIWSNADGNVVGRYWLKQIGMEVGGSGSPTSIYNVPANTDHGTMDEIFQWGQFPSPNYQTDGVAEPTYTQLIAPTATDVLTRIGIMVRDARGTTDPGVAITLEVYEIVDDDITPGAAVDGALVATSETLHQTDWAGAARGDVTTFAFSDAATLTSGKYYRVKVVLDFNGWVPDEDTGGLHGATAVHGENANETPNDVLNLTSGLEDADMPVADRGFWASMASWMSDIPHMNDFISDAALASNMAYVSGVNPSITVVQNVPFTIGDSSFSPDYDLDLSTLIQARIDDAGYSHDDPLCLVLGLKDVVGVSTSFEIFLPKRLVVDLVPQLWVDWIDPVITPPTLLAPPDTSTTFDTTPTLFWEAGAAGSPDAFHAQLSQNPDPAIDPIQFLVTAGDEWTVTELAVGTYYWHVRESRFGLWSEFTTPWSFTVADADDVEVIVEVQEASATAEVGPAIVTAAIPSLDCPVEVPAAQAQVEVKLEDPEVVVPAPSVDVELE